MPNSPQYIPNSPQSNSPQYVPNFSQPNSPQYNPNGGGEPNIPLESPSAPNILSISSETIEPTSASETVKEAATNEEVKVIKIE
jgi:hypothetical protein